MPTMYNIYVIRIYNNYIHQLYTYIYIYVYSDETDSTSGTQHSVDALSEFQRSIITHTLKFPNTQKVVYSTCSIHQEEVYRCIQYIPVFSMCMYTVYMYIKQICVFNIHYICDVY